MGKNGVTLAVLGFCAGSALTYVLVQLQLKKRQRDLREYEQYFGANSIRKELADKLGPGSEGLVSGIMQHLWTTCWNPAGCAMMKEIMAPILKDTFPTGPLSDMKIIKLDLGETPMKLDNIVVHDVTTTDDDAGNPSCQFDMDLLWDGRCDIQIRAPKIGSNLGVRSIKLYGRMSVVLKPLTQELPCIAGISYAFINSPHLSIDLTGLASIGEFSALDNTVKSTLKDTLDGMAVLPNRMSYKMDTACSILQMYTPPKGIIRIVIVSSRGFVIEKRTLGADDVPDVYCKVSVGNARVVRTSTVGNNLAPSWANEPMDFVLHDYDEFLNLHAWDEDDGALDADDDLGKIAGNIRIRDLLLAPNRTLELELFDSDDATKSMGSFVTVQGTILPLSPMEAVNTSIPGATDGTTSSASVVTKHLVPGLMNVLVAKAYNIPQSAQDAGTFVRIRLSTGETIDTSIVQTLSDGSVDAKDPVYDGVFEVPLSPTSVAAQPDATLTLCQVSKDPEKPKILGSTTVTWKDLQVNPVIQEKREIGSTGISLEFNVTLRGTRTTSILGDLPATPEATAVVTQSASAPEGSAARSAPPTIKATKTSIPSVQSGLSAAQVGSSTSSLASAPSTRTVRKVRIVAVRGRGFVIRRKGALRKKDIPDVYLKIKVGRNDKEWRTKVIKDNVAPEWNDAKVFELTDINATPLVVEGWDKNSGAFDDDDFYGAASTTVGKVLLAGGVTDLELLGGKHKRDPTGLFITFQCSLESA